jgi:hypothetical protein
VSRIVKTTPAPFVTPAREGTLGLPPDPQLPTILYGEMTALEFVTRFGTRSFYGRMYGVVYAGSLFASQGVK